MRSLGRWLGRHAQLGPYHGRIFFLLSGCIRSESYGVQTSAPSIAGRPLSLALAKVERPSFMWGTSDALEPDQPFLTSGNTGRSGAPAI